LRRARVGRPSAGEVFVSPCHFRAVRTALDRKRGITCHLLPSKLL
jgi:hypothetical protein